MLNIHTRILVHLNQTHRSNGNGAASSSRRGSNHSPPRMSGSSRNGDGDRMEGMDHDSSDTLAAEPKRRGGLMQSGNVSFYRPTPGGLKLTIRYTLSNLQLLDRLFSAWTSLPRRKEPRQPRVRRVWTRLVSGSRRDKRKIQTAAALQVASLKVGDH